jgi:hypothetical protein
MTNTTESMHRREHALKTGKGGWKCNCCGPAPRHRGQYRRAERRRAKHALKKDLKAQDVLGR